MPRPLGSKMWGISSLEAGNTQHDDEIVIGDGLSS